MKNKFIVILSILLLLGTFSACESFHWYVSSETNTESPAETTTDASDSNSSQIRLQSAEDSATYFLETLQSKNIDKIIELICVDINLSEIGYRTKVYEAYSFFNEINIEKYTIMDKQDFTDCVRFSVELVVDNGNKVFPDGISVWTLECFGTQSERSSVTMFTRSNNKIVEIFKEQNPIGFLCAQFSSELYCYETISNLNEIVPDSKDTEQLTYFVEGIIRCLPAAYDGPDVSRKQVLEQSEKQFGLTNIPVEKSANYNRDADTVTLGYVGGIWIASSLVSDIVDMKTKIHSVTISYYSDYVYLLPSKTVEYSVKVNDDGSLKLLSTELLYDSDIYPATYLI